MARAGCIQFSLPFVIPASFSVCTLLSLSFVRATDFSKSELMSHSAFGPSRAARSYQM